MARRLAPCPEKEARLAAFLAQRGAEAVLLTDRANIAWLANGADVHCDLFGASGVAQLLWSPQQRLVLTSNIEAARLAEEEFGDAWSIQSAPWWTPHAALPYPRLVCDTDPDDPLAAVRAPLTAGDVERLRSLGRDAADATQEALLSTHPGERELDVAARWIHALRARDLQVPVCLVAADERAYRYRHPIPTEARVQRNLLAGMCATRDGLVVCLSRILSVGTPSADLVRRHAAVRQVERALHEATRAGQTLGQVLQAGMSAYASVGFAEEWQHHHQGGPMGYRTRERIATPNDPTLVVAGQSYGWNPSIAGVKAEDTLFVDSRGVGEVLTRMTAWPLEDGRPAIAQLP
jgi:Xaa-Pro aminopeptidase